MCVVDIIARLRGATSIGTEQIWLGPGQPRISAEAVVQPAADIVARRATTMNDFVMAPTAAQITRPARATGFLAVDMAFREPVGLERPVYAIGQPAHRACCITDEPVAGR
jgi:hypothetical protein